MVLNKALWWAMMVLSRMALPHETTETRMSDQTEKTAGLRWDFSWDAEGDLGVWVQHNGREVLVEAMEMVEVEDADGGSEWEPTGEYTLASRVTLKAGDTVWIGGCCYEGRNAETALWSRRLAENLGVQIPVNERQRALLGELEKEA